MTDVAGAAPDQMAGRGRSSIVDLIRVTEIDLRQFGMVVALIAIWIGLGFQNSTILQPVNFLSFSVQAAGTAILATGMVLVIVSRNIDLSVGSVVGFIGMFYAYLMANVFPATIGVNHPLAWIIAMALGVLLGILIGGFLGLLIS
jgi:D-xylose transport system permease protein